MSCIVDLIPEETIHSTLLSCSSAECLEDDVATVGAIVLPSSVCVSHRYWYLLNLREFELIAVLMHV